MQSWGDGGMVGLGSCEFQWSGGVVVVVVVVLWDNRVVQCLEMEMVTFSVSYCFQNCEDGFCWCYGKILGVW